MSPVEFKKRPCRPVDLRVKGPSGGPGPAGKGVVVVAQGGGVKG